jgi:hypothetical protein
MSSLVRSCIAKATRPSAMAGRGRLGILDRFLNWDAGPPRNTSCLEAIATIGIDIGKNTFAQDTRAPSDLAQDTLKRVVGANPPHGCFEGWELTERGKRELKRVQKPLMQSV